MTTAKRRGGLQFAGSNPSPDLSRSMRKHRRILATILKSRDLSHAAIAKLMGWASPSAVGNKLRGERGWASGELERMCELAGITVVHLAELSDDLVLTKHPESITAARMVDDMPAHLRESAMQYLRMLNPPKGT